jgi:hypothetical protein
LEISQALPLNACQVREHWYDQCTLQIEFDFEVKSVKLLDHWNTDKNKFASITSAEVRFEYKLERSVDPNTGPIELPKRRWLFF